MMKKLKLLFFIFISSFISFSAFANLYLQTEYQEGNKPKVITKQHIFLNKREIINYTKKGYILILKKINGNEATIESESYDFDKLGRRTMVGGSYGTYQVGKYFTITDRAPNGTKLFELKILLEKIVPTKP